jgi:hypothetical protein
MTGLSVEIKAGTIYFIAGFLVAFMLGTIRV